MSTLGFTLTSISRTADSSYTNRTNEYKQVSRYGLKARNHIFTDE